MATENLINIPIMAELAAVNKSPEYLFWVGSAGSYDDKAKKISRAFAKILAYCNIDYAILGTEETDSGEVAKRAGNEFLFQMKAMQNIETFKMYQVKNIITCCPHDYNTLKNEYPEFGCSFKVYHHSEFIYQLIENGKLKLEDSLLRDKKICYHDPCYLGRGNNNYDFPRQILTLISPSLVEMSRNRGRSLCCGAGGSQMFKEAEKGDMEIYTLRIKDVLEVQPQILATSCPFCMLMLSDGLKMSDAQEHIKIFDIAELIVMALGI